MKKSLIFKLLYLFLVLIVMAGASVFATNTYLANQVSYGNTNVEDALNGLFSLKENTYNYSTDEQIIGKWTDGKPIYRKVLNFDKVSANSMIWIPLNTTIDNYISVTGGSYEAKSNSTFINIPRVHQADIKYQVGILPKTNTDTTNPNQIRISCGSGISLENGYLIVEYTKKS